MSSTDVLTPEEKTKVDILRQRVEHLLKNEKQRSDMFLIRWLVARNMDLDKAEEMLVKSLEWRKVNGVDGILDREEIPEKVRKRYMLAHVGEDKDGYPIILVPCGRHDHRIHLEEFGVDNFLKYNIIWIETINKIVEETVKKTGKPVIQYHQVIDFEHYSVRHMSYKPSLDYIMQSQKQFDENYPEFLKSITVINAPKIFPVLFSLFKPLMTKQTLEKLNVFGTDEEKWKAYLREKFPMERFPPRWSGTLQGSDEFCSQEDVWLYSPIPLRYFKEVEGEDEEGFYTVKIPARENFKVELEIVESNTRLEWKFRTELHDIAFGVQFDNPGEKNIPVERVSSQASLQEGFIICNCRGKVTLIFDNKFSLTTAKNLRYKIDMIPPTVIPTGNWNMNN